MTPTPHQLLLLLGGVCLLFACVIALSLRARRAIMAENLNVRAQELFEPYRGSEWDMASLLYGVFQDFTATELGMIVRDCHDEEVGRITFHAGRRLGWITLEAGEMRFEADVLPTWSQEVALHGKMDAEVLCHFRRGFGGVYWFEAQGLGSVVSRPPKGFRMTPTFEYFCDKKRMGLSRHLGGALDRGVLLLMSGDIPLPIRLFILAMQTRRA